MEGGLETSRMLLIRLRLEGTRITTCTGRRNRWMTIMEQIPKNLGKNGIELFQSSSINFECTVKYDYPNRIKCSQVKIPKRSGQFYIHKHIQFANLDK